MLRGVCAGLLAALFTCLAADSTASAATLSPTLQSQLATLANSANVGTVIVGFHTTNGLNDLHLDALRNVGITRGIKLARLGMVATTATVGQVRALAANSSVRSVWSNDKLHYFMNEARVLTGVDRLRTHGPFTLANGGLPVSGQGNFSVVINDSGIDATHGDLSFGSHVIENVQILTDTETLTGFTTLVAVAGVPNTDSHVGHGTHCAGIVGGTGQQSGGRYAGVAPGAKLIGTGSGAGLFVLSALGGFEWSLSNQSQHNIRVISNSWGSSGDFDPDNPINIATKKAYDNNIISVFAAGNSGPGPDTHNPYGKAPWVISVAAGTKEGGLASFSSRGIPREERLADSDPLNDHDAPTITAPGTGREFASNSAKFTSAIVATRSTSNVVANGGDADLEIPLSFLPFYTQISGTSMSCPHVAGVIALMLDADPTLTPDEVKQFIRETATRMPGREDYEVGAGYINAFAAVDKVFNRSRAYGAFLAPNFNTGITVTYDTNVEGFSIDFAPQPPGRTSTNTYPFNVNPDLGILDVRVDFGTSAATDEAGNSLGLLLYPPGCAAIECGYNSGLTLPALDSPRRQVVVKNPAAGAWVAEVRGLRGLTAVPATLPVSVAIPERVDGRIKRAALAIEEPSDIQGHAAAQQIRAALANRMMDTFPDNTFRPDANVKRGDFAWLLGLNTPLRQSLGATPKFSDVSVELAAIAEAATSKGSTLRDWNFTPDEMISASGSRFRPEGLVSRINLAVAFVRALGLDAEAQAKAGTAVTVTHSGQTLILTDTADIPSALRGYVQIALDKQLLQAFFTVEQGPFHFVPTLKARVKPNDPATRAFMAHALDNFRQRFVAGT